MDYQASKVDKTFDKVVAELDRYSKVFRKDGQLERATAEIGGDIAWFNDIRDKLDELIDTVNDAHMYAMVDHVDMGESVNEATAKIACVKCDEVSTAAAWKKNNGFCPKCKTSSQGVAESKSVKGKKLTEGVLDSDDEDGFMARSQLYFLARDAITLHGMIGDRDNLEPWVQTKIANASEGIDAVRRYTEYNAMKQDSQLPVPMEMEEDAGKPNFPIKVKLAGDSIWDDKLPEFVTVTDYNIDENEGAINVYVKHNGPWEIYTDSGFEKAISEMTGIRDLSWSEQGMQKPGTAHLESFIEESMIGEGMAFNEKRDGQLKTVAQNVFKSALSKAKSKAKK